MPAEYVKTLRYWFDVEALMYPDIPKPGKRRHYVLRYSDKFPWSNALPANVQDDHKYFVYFGLVEKKVLESEVLEIFCVEPEKESYSGNHVRIANGKTFLCAIEITADGKPVISTLQFAAFSVAFAERKNGKRISYSATVDSLKDKIQNLLSDSPTGIANANWFQQVTEFLIEELAWQPRELMAREQVCVHHVPLVGKNGKKYPKVPEMDPINSFYLDDLERMLLNAEHGSGSIQIQRYLGGHEASSNRIDITKLEVVNTLLDARRFPVGRWPSKFPLFLMQQVAVNTGLEVLNNGGIFSVNGPPGTGKTTLLMDVIAARIVERAKVLAEYSNPERAFTKTKELVTYPPKAGVSATGPCFYVDEKLLDFGIVVASANNKAVENITLDLPNIEKVSSQPLLLDDAPFDYFAASAESILNDAAGKVSKLDGTDVESTDGFVTQAEVDDAEESEHGLLKCWGLISVRLGNKSNRNLVAKCLGRFAEFGLAGELEKMDSTILDWESARAKFKATVGNVLEIQASITKYDKALPTYDAAQIKLSTLRTTEIEANQRNRSAQEVEKGIAENSENNERQLETNLTERKQLTLEWPWWRQLLERLFRHTNFRWFEAQRQELSDDYDKLSEERANLKRSLALAGMEANKALAALRSAQSAVESCEKEIACIASEIREISEMLGTAAFNPKKFGCLTVDEQQKSLPRNNATYQAARSEVFLAAMHLHKAFMKNAGKPFETNFRLALAMLEQQSYIQKNLPTMAPHLWAAFFLAVPVVSSTFASISRCFRDLGEGQIGLLLVDEAGQAVPSHALGSIWRSKRALIVGDPLQVEPVITMDKKLDYAILKYHDSPEEHLLTENSAQHLADRGNRFGANVVQYDGSDLWVGSPLRVHRRCVDPMFSLSNNIAYNGKMVFGPEADEEEHATKRRPLLGESRWLDILPDDFSEHFSANEGDAAVDIVATYKKQGWTDKKDGLPDLFLISPFKSVATGLTSALRDRIEEWAKGVDDEAVTKWLKGHVGTVHTFQGKECESVVFVLGGKTSGARSWAGNRPNIINVAATRAKRRLYVIGSKRNWVETTFGEKLLTAMEPLGSVKLMRRA